MTEKKINVLVVDDESAIREMIHFALGKSNMTVRCAASGKAALLFGNYVQNQTADENDEAYAFGFKYGAAKNKGEWQFGYVYQKLEADSLLGLLTDSDFGGGGTNSKGSIIKGSYAIYKNFNANLTYFVNDVGLDLEDPIDFKRLQLDLSFKY